MFGKKFEKVTRAVYEMPLFPTNEGLLRAIVTAGEKRWTKKVLHSLELTIDALGMAKMIAEGLVWSEKKADSFFTGDFAPYDDFELPEDPHDQTVTIMLALRYLSAQYHLGTGDEEQDMELGFQLTGMAEIAIAYLMGEAKYALGAWSSGLFRGEDGYMVCAERLAEVEHTVREVAEEHNVGPDELVAEVMEITEGWDSLAYVTIGQSDLAFPLQEALLRVGVLGNKREVAERRIEIGHVVASFLAKVGLLYEDFLGAMGLPPAAKIFEALELFIAETGLLAEVMEKETPTAHGCGQVVSASAVLWEAASVCGLPKHVLSPTEIREQAEDLEGYVGKIMTFKGAPSVSILECPLALGGNLRPVNISYYDPQERLVGAVLLNPRRSRVEYLRSLAHEEVHRVHGSIVKAGEDCGVVKSGTWHHFPDEHLEWFAVGGEESVAACYLADWDVAEKGKTELWSALIKLRQGPYALIQASTWLALQELDLDRAPTPEEIELVIQLQEQLIDRLYLLPIGNGTVVSYRDMMASANNYEPFEILDGLRYVYRDAMALWKEANPSPEPEPEEEGMEDVDAGDTDVGVDEDEDITLHKLLTELTGSKEWIRLPLGRKLMLVGLAQSGINPKVMASEIRRYAKDRDALGARIKELVVIWKVYDRDSIEELLEESCWSCWGR